MQHQCTCYRWGGVRTHTRPNEHKFITPAHDSLYKQRSGHAMPTLFRLQLHSCSFEYTSIRLFQTQPNESGTNQNCGIAQPCSVQRHTRCHCTWMGSRPLSPPTVAHEQNHKDVITCLRKTKALRPPASPQRRTRRLLLSPIPSCLLLCHVLLRCALG